MLEAKQGFKGLRQQLIHNRAQTALSLWQITGYNSNYWLALQLLKQFSGSISINVTLKEHLSGMRDGHLKISFAFICHPDGHMFMFNLLYQYQHYKWSNQQHQYSKRSTLKEHLGGMRGGNLMICVFLACLPACFSSRKVKVEISCAWNSSPAEDKHGYPHLNHVCIQTEKLALKRSKTYSPKNSVTLTQPRRQNDLVPMNYVF